MSNINFGAIDATYPIAGQDNDSQGFRENFAAIQSALETAKTEITALETYSVLKADLQTNDAVDNNLSGSTISNATYKQLNGVVPGEGLIEAEPVQIVDVDNGPLQVFVIPQDLTTLTFQNWAGTGSVPVFGQVRLHLVSSNGGAWNVVIANQGGSVVYEENFETLVLNPDGLTHSVLEVWSYDGDVAFVRSLGNYTLPA